MRETNDTWQTHWVALAERWQSRLASVGLGGIAEVVSQALKPLAPFAAQLLWFAQPGFALLGYSDALHSLAELLDAPQQHSESLPFAVDSSQTDEHGSKL